MSGSTVCVDTRVKKSGVARERIDKSKGRIEKAKGRITTRRNSKAISLAVTDRRADIFAEFPLERARHEIRLLVLQPSPNIDDPISCYLTTVSLDTYGNDKLSTTPALPYEAISYTWGGYTAGKSITFCGRLNFHVTDSLYAALRRLRQADRTRTLWVDALCIDQAHNSERNWQVTLMGQIYSEADGVIIWLGDYDPQYEPLADKDVNWRQWIIESSWALGITIIRASPLFWWDRAWILQEAILARRPPKFYFGSCVWDWNYLVVDDKLPGTFPSVRWDAHDDVVRLCHQVTELGRLRRGMSSRQGHPSIAQFFACLSRCEATDPRDMVYCLLGMIRKREREGIVPSYDQGIADCYCEATVALISSEGHLAHIGLSQHGDFPTWAIDFTFSATRHLDYSSRAWLILSNLMRRDSSPDNPFSTTTEPPFRRDGQRLKVSGYIMDRIKKKEVALEGQHQLQSLEHGQEMYRSSLKTFFSDFPSLHPRQALMDHNTDSPVFPKLPDPDWTVFRQVFDFKSAACERLGLSLADAWYSATGLETPMLSGFWWHNILRYSKIVSDHEPMWFMSSYGFLGYSPRLVQPDDVICLVTCNAHPMILRKVEDGYNFVSFAWIPGLMNHEVDGILYEIGTTEIDLI